MALIQTGCQFYTKSIAPGPQDLLLLIAAVTLTVFSSPIGEVMGRQKYPNNSWVWYKKDGRYCRGIVSGFNPLTSEYAVQAEGNSRVKPLTITADRLKPNPTAYEPGEKIQFQSPDSNSWQNGIADRPASPTEYKVKGDGSTNWITVKNSRIRKRH